MGKLLVFLSLALLLAGVGAGCVSDQISYPSDLSTGELEKRLFKAIDPQERLKTAKSYSITYIVKAQWWFFRDYFEIVVKYKSPNRFSVLTKHEDEPISALLFNQDAAWLVNYQDQTIKSLEDDELEKMRYLYLLLTPSQSYRDLFADQQVFVGTRDGQEFYQISATGRVQNAQPLKVELDSREFLIRNLSGKVMVDNPLLEQVGDAPFTAKIQEYTDLNSVLLPKFILADLNGSTLEITLDRARLDLEVDASEFLPPFFATKNPNSGK